MIQSNTPAYSAGKEAGTTTGQISSYNGYTYTYDKNGNILSISDGTYTTSYEYDSANQLVRENNQQLGFTHTWTYDNGGNIRSRSEYPYTTGALGTPTNTVEYAYKSSSIWGDMIDAYGANDYLPHDGAGNLRYDGTWIYNWENGRELISMTQGETAWTFSYDANGMRKSRNHSSGYGYDWETGLYYLQSRYYDPEWGRFINADIFPATGQGFVGNNMFAYCLNNPALLLDYSGKRACLPPAWTYDGYDEEPTSPPPYLNSQKDPSIAGMSFGLASVSHGGCGVLATYNALVKLGTNPSFDTVLESYNSRILDLNLLGFTGMSPQRVADYFKEKGYRVVQTSSPYVMDVHSRLADACIMYYEYDIERRFLGMNMVFWGAHFIFYERTSGGYTGYNVFSGGGSYDFTSVMDFLTYRNYHHPVGIYIYLE